MLGHFTGDGRIFFRPFFEPDQQKTQFWRHDTQPNKLMAPYRENYVHQILIFFVRNSFESTIKRPSRAGSTLQCDRRGPVAIKTGRRFWDGMLRTGSVSRRIAMEKVFILYLIYWRRWTGSKDHWDHDETWCEVETADVAVTSSYPWHSL